jgi:hypothetical protein
MEDGFLYEVGDVRAGEVKRAVASAVEKAVEGEEGLAGGGCWEGAMGRETAVETPSKENGLTDVVIVR